MTAAWCCAVPGGIRLTVQIMPNAKKNEVVGVIDDALKIRIHAQPVEGKANEALMRFLAETLDVPKSSISIARGHTGKRKTVSISAAGLLPDAAIRRLAPDSMK